MPAIIFFDGVCNLCDSSVQFIIKKDTQAYFQFAPLQSNIAEEILKPYGLKPAQLESMILLENNSLYFKSSAALKISQKLSGIYPLAYYIFYPLPPIFRDWVYEIIAKYRYKIWGKKEQCMLPSPEIKSRFLA